MQHEITVGRQASSGTHQDELEQGSLVDLDEVAVKGLHLLLRFAGLLVGTGAGLLLRLHVVLAVLDHLAEDLPSHVRQRDNRIRARVCASNAASVKSKYGPAAVPNNYANGAVDTI